MIASLRLLLAKEKVLLTGIATIALLAFLTRGLLFVLVWERQWQFLIGIVLCLAIIAVALFAKVRDGWRVSYKMPKGITIVQFLIAIGSVLITWVLAE